MSLIYESQDLASVEQPYLLIKAFNNTKPLSSNTSYKCFDISLYRVASLMSLREVRHTPIVKVSNHHFFSTSGPISEQIEIILQ